MTLFSALRRSLVANLGLRPTGPVDTLYANIVAEARQPGWYLAGEVPDTLDGRFDMVALVLSFVLIRLEDEGGEDGGANGRAGQISADLTERFIADMDGTLRQDGVGDQTVGKHIGRMVAALGGRLGAYRDARGDDAEFAAALRRNLWRGADVPDAAVDFVIAAARRLAGRLDATPLAALAEGRFTGAAA